MEENQTNESLKFEKEQKSRKRVFALLVFLCLVFLAAIVYEIIMLVR